jgi:hypothetical protein
MTSTGLWCDIAAIVAVPIAVWLLACGFGLLVERLTATRLPNALLVPLGFCLSVVVALGIYTAGAGDDIAVPVVVAIAVLGFMVARRELPARLAAGWPLVAALVTYLIFNASVLASGHWTFTGYNIENDSAYELLLVAHLQAHGTQAASHLSSTANTVLSSYLTTGYPLGAQSLLAVLSGLLGVSAAVVWQGFISSMAAVGAMALASLSGRTMGRRLAALTAVVAMGAALTYQYALQGSIKEIGVLVATLCALAVMRHAILSLRALPGVVLTAIPLAAILATYSAAGLPYVAALVGSGLVAILLVHRRLPLRGAIRPAVVGGATLLVLAIPILPTIGTFLQVARSGYTGPHASAPSLGPLFRVLPLSEVSGVWLYGDYRLPVPPGLGWVLTTAATVLILALLAPALLRLLAAREPGPLIGLLTMALVLVVVMPRAVPYAQAKLLAIASPVVILVAAQALTGARGRDWKSLCAVAAACLGGVVLASDAIAYHAFPVAPTARLVALQQVGERLGERGPVLDSEFEQFAKYFAQPARLIVGPDSPTPESLSLRDPVAQYGHSFDLDQEKLQFVESFPYVLTRRAPTTSRPPANFRRIFENAFYELWQRTALPRVYAHLPLGEGVSAGGVVRCAPLRRFVRRAPTGARLAVAVAAPTYGYQLANATFRSPGWATDGELPGGFLTVTPGHAEREIRVRSSGRYWLWIQGDLPRQVSVTLDGRTVGAAQGANTPGGWLSAGVVQLGAGRHLLGVVRGGGGVGPGDGSTQASIGAVALVSEQQPERIVVTARSDWRSICGRQADWVELIGAA